MDKQDLEFASDVKQVSSELESSDSALSADNGENGTETNGVADETTRPTLTDEEREQNSKEAVNEYITKASLNGEDIEKDSKEIGKSEKYDAGDIQVLEGLEPVRKRPGMYIGSTDEHGLHHLVTEVVDNSIDEALAGYCTQIDVVINFDGSCSVIDNGRGIPTGIIPKEGKSAVEVVLTKLHAGGKFGGEGYKISGGLHGVGVSCVNALSKYMRADVYQNNQHYKIEFSRGKVITPLEVVGATTRRGTTITFLPDDEIFETTVFNFDTMKNRFREIAFLNKGLVISLEDKREGQERKEVFEFKGGIVEFVDYLNKNRETLLSAPVYFNKFNRNAKGELDNEVEVCFQFNEGYSEVINAYANNINTEEGGTHLDGFKSGLTKVINDYALANKIIKENEKLSGEDCREGITAVISVKLRNPQFEGQTKTKLGNSEMRNIVYKAMIEEFGDYLDRHPNEAKNLILKSITAQRAREAARNAREFTRRKSVLENTTHPGKLAVCCEKYRKFCEIYIVEGDSAGGTAKTGRDRRFQAILPLRGKILNVEKARLNKILENNEIKSMITAFGCGIGDEFNEDKLRYDKIICMTDADVDGAHIRILLLTFFFRYMRPLIEHGHVYAAKPPLYKVTRNKEDYYFYSDEELEEWYQSNSRKGCAQQRYKGLGEMNAEQLWETTMDPERRILIQLTMEDAIEAEKYFNDLMGEDSELRRKFIEENANLVNMEDIDA